MNRRAKNAVFKSFREQAKRRQIFKPKTKIGEQIKQHIQSKPLINDPINETINAPINKTFNDHTNKEKQSSNILNESRLIISGFIAEMSNEPATIVKRLMAKLNIAIGEHAETAVARALKALPFSVHQIIISNNYDSDQIEREFTESLYLMLGLTPKELSDMNLNDDAYLTGMYN